MISVLTKADFVVAGGCVFALQFGRTFKDIDVFVLEHQQTPEKLQHLSNILLQYKLPKKKSSKKPQKPIRFQLATNSCYLHGRLKPVNVIFSPYSSAEEVISAFDLPCCRIAVSQSRILIDPTFKRRINSTTLLTLLPFDRTPEHRTV